MEFDPSHLAPESTAGGWSCRDLSRCSTGAASVRGPGERPLSLGLGEALPLCPPEAVALGLGACGQSRPWRGNVVPVGLLPPPWLLPAMSRASLTPGVGGRPAAPHPLPRGGATLPRGPGPSVLPPAPQTLTYAQEAVGSRRDHCGPGARGHFLGSQSYSVWSPGGNARRPAPRPPAATGRGMWRPLGARLAGSGLVVVPLSDN